MKRREFLQWSGGVWAAALAARPLAALAAQQGSAPATLDAKQWQQVTAICEQIIPTVDGFGATGANCVNFIDKLLANEERNALPHYRLALADIDAHAKSRWGKTLAAANADRQRECLENLEDGKLQTWRAPLDQPSFFAMLRFHTILGFLAAPKFGGNADFAGWRALNFPGHLHEMGGLTDAQVTGAEPIEAGWHRH
jgi:gluconate 2-dehydrogenase gamma chain